MPTRHDDPSLLQLTVQRLKTPDLLERKRLVRLIGHREVAEQPFQSQARHRVDRFQQAKRLAPAHPVPPHAGVDLHMHSQRLAKRLRQPVRRLGHGRFANSQREVQLETSRQLCLHPFAHQQDRRTNPGVTQLRRLVEIADKQPPCPRPSATFATATAPNP